MINRQERNLAQRNCQSLEQVRIELRGLDQTSALTSHDDRLRPQRPLEMDHQRELLDKLNPNGDSTVTRPGVLTLQMPQL